MTDPQAARAEALAKLQEQRGTWAAVRRVVSSLTTLGEDNHFSGRIVDAMRGIR